MAIAAVTVAAITGGKLPDRMFSAALATLVVAAAAVDGLLRGRLRTLKSRDPLGTPATLEAGGPLQGGADAGIAGPSGIIAFAWPALFPWRAWRRPGGNLPAYKFSRGLAHNARTRSASGLTSISPCTRADVRAVAMPGRGSGSPP